MQILHFPDTNSLGTVCCFRANHRLALRAKAQGAVTIPLDTATVDLLGCHSESADFSPLAALPAEALSALYLGG